MRGIQLVLFLFIGNALLWGQSWQLTEMQDMPLKISNNSVAEAFVNGVPYVYSFGGIDSNKIYSGITNKSFKYNVVTDVWDTIPALPDPMTKIAAAASYVNGKIYIIGGYTVFANGNEVSSNKIHRFDPVADTFLTDGATIPVPIDDHVQAVYKDSLIYVVTGWSNTDNVKNVQIYDTYLDTWTAGTQVPFNQYRVFGSTGTIIGDTIYYFGGAERGANFPAANILRKGAIDPQDPTQITWSFSIPDPSVFAYRPACTQVGNEVFWIGGSSTSYNYNGIAYNGSGGVQPSNRSIAYAPGLNRFSTMSPNVGSFPMDLRGIASINDSLKYIVGGMEANQQVSNKTYRLEYSRISTGLNNVKQAEFNVSLYPNPAKNKLNIKNKAEELIAYQLLNAEGAVFKSGWLSPSADLSIDISGLQAGVYFFKLSTETKSKVRKLVIIE